MRHRISFWTGPTLVRELANKMREAGLNVVCEGTERVYVDAIGRSCGGARNDALVDIERTHGTSFGLK